LKKYLNFPVTPLTFQGTGKTSASAFANVFGKSVSFGMISGTLGRAEYDKDYIFAIIYDEAHHTTADTYKKVIDYFSPKLSLGMTATRERLDFL
jgi:superfamily II DNA or RNA helicase